MSWGLGIIYFIYMANNATPIDMKHLQQLSRLELTAEEAKKFEGQLTGILEYFKQLDAVDTSGIEPTSHALPLENVWQADVARPGFTNEQALMNAPKKRAGEFVVPRVVEE